MVRWPVWSGNQAQSRDSAPSDTTGGAAYPAPGVAPPVIAADPGTDIEVGTAGGLFPDVGDFDPSSAWGAGVVVMRSQ